MNIENIKVATFSKVSFRRFRNDIYKAFPHIADNIDEFFIDHDLFDMWQNIKLPKRGTIDSAGYDFFCPFGISIEPNSTVTIPTGIRCEIDKGWVLSIYPRSGLGFKHGIRLSNSVGIIDGDYAFADNEGHIFIKLVNDSPSAVTVDLGQGKAFCQGVFLPYGITYDDDVKDKRTGGLGSTDSTTNSK